ncbi:MAG: ATP-dependent RNA helicase HrpA [Desulfobacteraceae bacterium]|nr:ATP-dependent RNA helicase HrpA [Desulfobacteraceae bacterium]
MTHSHPRKKPGIADSAFIPSYPSDLPIIEWRDRIVRAVQEHQVLVITGETGSGKSTQIPKFCIEAGRGVAGMIGCTQPRRIAAITLAARVSEELGADGPGLVGHKIRFQDRTGKNTRIKFMTDGILLAEAQRDRNFRAYDTIIVDEAHERTLNIDFLLGILKQTLPKRPELKVIITSATIDPEKFSKAFGDAPIIEVSGRTYPVEVWYRPVRTEDEEAGDLTHIDQAVEAVELLKRSPAKRGDILVFMPTESDIRETVQRLEEKRFMNTTVLPLFGRMAANDQQRIFQPLSEDKIVVATNVAETSITIPRIRYVVDTGLARIAQYNARSRTNSLPVSAISQASADQRKGRCGRVEAGICVRLYSEKDYLDRLLYTQPEIQRSNLAEVILRMLFLKLGKVQDFPFIDPPSPAAIKDGFGVLRELGAVDEHQRLTQTGKTMARLPVDPRISRMLLEARLENALREVGIIAAALSIQDPRERPLEQETQADQAQAVFRDTRSDFVSLLKIWQACWQEPVAGNLLKATSGASPDAEFSEPDVPVREPANGAQPGRRSAGQLKKFCRRHFLSFRRMREWRDIYEEIRSILGELGDFIENPAPAGYDAIHRSILSGYLSQVALRKERNIFTAARGKQAMIFPGSGLFGKAGPWIVASEMVQTSRFYARTAANIDPAWLEQVGRHLCKYSWSEPHWEKRRGQVAAFEKVTLYGLTVADRRKVDFGRINPKEARQIFIRSALVEGELPGKYPFLEHNRELVARIEELENKTRRRDLLVDEEVLFRFYEERIPEFADLRSFNRMIREHGGDSFLRMTEEDLLRSQPDFAALEQFPDTFQTGSAELPLKYDFRPGEERDGVSLTVPVHTLPALAPDRFEWLVPGLLQEKVLLLFKSLPKSLRKNFVPVNETARRIALSLDYGEGNLYVQLSAKTFALTGVRVSPEQWDGSQLPDHLRMRFEVTGPKGDVLSAGRQIEDLRPLAMERHDDRLWKEARSTWERDGITEWDFGPVPASIEIGTDALGLPRHAYPGFCDEDGRVALRLFTDPDAARESTRSGLMRLYRIRFSAQLKAFRKDWGFPAQYASKVFFMGSPAEASGLLYDYILREIFDLQHPQPPDLDRFRKNIERTGGRLGEFGNRLLAEALEVVGERHETRSALDRFRKMAGGNGAVIERLSVISSELERLVPPMFLAGRPALELRFMPRILRAFRLRAERAYVSPEKDKTKELQVVPFESKLGKIEKLILAVPTEEGLAYLERLRAMIEEFKISLFAPEIKTLFPISAQRIEKVLRERPT